MPDDSAAHAEYLFRCRRACPDFSARSGPSRSRLVISRASLPVGAEIEGGVVRRRASSDKAMGIAFTTRTPSVGALFQNRAVQERADTASRSTMCDACYCARENIRERRNSYAPRRRRRKDGEWVRQKRHLQNASPRLEAPSFTRCGSRPPTPNHPPPFHLGDRQEDRCHQRHRHGGGRAELRHRVSSPTPSTAGEIRRASGGVVVDVQSGPSRHRRCRCHHSPRSRRRLGVRETRAPASFGWIEPGGGARTQIHALAFAPLCAGSPSRRPCLRRAVERATSARGLATDQKLADADSEPGAACR